MLVRAAKNSFTGASCERIGQQIIILRINNAHHQTLSTIEDNSRRCCAVRISGILPPIGLDLQVTAIDARLTGREGRGTAAAAAFLLVAVDAPKERFARKAMILRKQKSTADTQ